MGDVYPTCPYIYIHIFILVCIPSWGVGRVVLGRAHFPVPWCGFRIQHNPQNRNPTGFTLFLRPRSNFPANTLILNANCEKYKFLIWLFSVLVLLVQVVRAVFSPGGDGSFINKAALAVKYIKLIFCTWLY